MSLTDWNVTQPLDHSLIASIPGYLRDIQSSAKIILSKEHVQPSTSQAGGQHLKGSTRVYLESSTPTTDPEGNNLDTSATSDNGRVAVLTGSSNIIKVFANTSAGVSTSWQHAAVGRVYLADTMNANSKHVVGLPTATQSGSPLHVGQLDTTYFAGISTGAIQPKLGLASISTGLATSGTSVHVACTPVSYAGEQSVTLPNGMILKFGTATTSTYAAAISFSAAFPNALLAVTATIVQLSAEHRCIVVDTDPAAGVSGFSVLSYPDAAVDFYWMAIGY